MPVTKIGSNWLSGLLNFFRKDTGVTVLKVTESGIEANVTGNVTGNVSGYALKSAAVTATEAGDGTGIIPAGVTHAVITSSANTKLVTLPAPVPGLHLILVMGANGCKVRSSAPTTIGINGGTGAAVASAIAADTEVVLECMSATSWKAWTVAADGTWAELAAAA